MTIKTSTGLRNSMLDTESLKASLDDGILEIYDGAEPASADDATQGNLLVSITDNSQAIAIGNGLDFEAAAVGGLLEKLAGQTWSGVVGLTGVATYYRFVEYADRNGTGGGSSTTAKRIQGVVAAIGGDLNLDNPSLTATATLPITAYQIQLPE